MKVAILWLINEDGGILLSQRAAHMNSDASMWGPSVSGKVEDEETNEQAAVREAAEEIGVDPLEVTPIYHLHNSTYNHDDDRLREFFIFYSNADKPLLNRVKLEPGEVASMKWITLDGLKNVYIKTLETIIISSNTELWDDIFKNLEIAISRRLRRA